MKRSFALAASVCIGLCGGAASGQETAPAAPATESAPAQEPERKTDVVAWRARLITLDGVRYTGVAPRSRALDQFREADHDLAAVPGAALLDLRWFNGLNGSIAFRFDELKALELNAPLTRDDVAEMERQQIEARRSRLADEEVRLQRLADQRAEERILAELEALTAGAGGVRLEPELQEWLDLYPPEAGWVPARKADLYYQTIVLGTRAPSEDEQFWLDNYDAWKEAYDAWIAAQAELAPVDGAGAPTGVIPASPKQPARAPAKPLGPNAPPPAPKSPPIGGGAAP